jgi:hypothetical protein
MYPAPTTLHLIPARRHSPSEIRRVILSIDAAQLGPHLFCLARGKDEHTADEQARRAVGFTQTCELSETGRRTSQHCCDGEKSKRVYLAFVTQSERLEHRMNFLGIAPPRARGETSYSGQSLELVRREQVST